MLEPLRFACGDGSVEQCQMNGEIGIRMRYIGECVPDRYRDRKLLLALPRERLLLCLAGLHLPAGKFPL